MSIGEIRRAITTFASKDAPTSKELDHLKTLIQTSLPDLKPAKHLSISDIKQIKDIQSQHTNLQTHDSYKQYKFFTHSVKKALDSLDTHLHKTYPELTFHEIYTHKNLHEAIEYLKENHPDPATLYACLRSIQPKDRSTFLIFSAHLDNSSTFLKKAFMSHPELMHQLFHLDLTLENLTLDPHDRKELAEHLFMTKPYQAHALQDFFSLSPTELATLKKTNPIPKNIAAHFQDQIARKKLIVKSPDKLLEAQRLLTTKHILEALTSINEAYTLYKASIGQKGICSGIVEHYIEHNEINFKKALEAQKTQSKVTKTLSAPFHPSELQEKSKNQTGAQKLSIFPQSGASHALYINFDTNTFFDPNYYEGDQPKIFTFTNREELTAFVTTYLQINYPKYDLAQLFHRGDA